MEDISVKTYLKDGTAVEWGKRWIKSLNVLKQATTDAAAIQYGVLGCSGTIEINDVDDTIYGYIQNDKITQEDTIIEIYNKGKLYHTMRIGEISYSFTDKTLKIPLQDYNHTLLDRAVNGVGLIRTVTAFEHLQRLFTYAGISSTIDNATSAEINGVTIQDYLKSITIRYSYVKDGIAFKSAINEFCTITQLFMIENVDGSFKFINARPQCNRVDNSSIIVIKPNKIYSNFDVNITPQNKISTVGYTLNEGILEYKPIDTSDGTLYQPLSEEGSVATTTKTVWIGSTQRADNEVSMTFYSRYLSKYSSKSNSNQTSVGTLTVIGTAKLGTYSTDDYGVIYKYSINENDYRFETDVERKRILEVSQSVTEIFPVPSSWLESDKSTKVMDTEYCCLQTKVLSDTSIWSNTDTAPYNYGIPTGEIPENDKYGNIEYVYSSALDALKAICNLTDDSTIENFTINYISDISKPAVYKHNGVCDYYFAIETAAQIRTIGNDVSGKITFSDTKSFYYRKFTNKSTSYNPDADVILLSNTLMQPSAKIGDGSLVDTIINNIKTDYANGVSTATLSVAMTDYYSQKGEKIVDVNNGVSLQIGNIVKPLRTMQGDLFRVYPDGNPYLWKIVDISERFSGVPYWDLTLMEVKYYHAEYKLNISNKANVNINVYRSYSEHGGVGEIFDGDGLYLGDSLTITITGDNHYGYTYSLNGGDAQTIKMGGGTFTISSVDANISIVVSELTPKYYVFINSNSHSETYNPITLTRESTITSVDDWNVGFPIYAGDILTISDPHPSREYYITNGQYDYFDTGAETFTKTFTVDGDVYIAITDYSYYFTQTSGILHSTVTITRSDGSIIPLDGTTSDSFVYAGEVVEINVKPEKLYEINSITVNGEILTESSYTVQFSTAYFIGIAVDVSEAHSYVLWHSDFTTTRISSDVGADVGTLSSNPETIYAGDVINIYKPASSSTSKMTVKIRNGDDLETITTTAGEDFNKNITVKGTVRVTLQ